MAQGGETQRHPADDAFVGLDLGTSGVRAVAIDRQGRELAAVGVPAFPFLRGEDGRSERHPMGGGNAP